MRRHGEKRIGVIEPELTIVDDYMRWQSQLGKLGWGYWEERKRVMGEAYLIII